MCKSTDSRYFWAGFYKILERDKALKKVSKQYNTDECTIVAIRELKEVNELYGMDEADFIAGAKILDPATRKEIETEQADAETAKQADVE